MIEIKKPNPNPFYVEGAKKNSLKPIKRKMDNMINRGWFANYQEIIQEIEKENKKIIK